MGVKHIHVVLIVVSIILSIFFGLWTLNHHYEIWAYVSFATAAGLLVYCVQFIRKIRAL